MHSKTDVPKKSNNENACCFVVDLVFRITIHNVTVSCIDSTCFPIALGTPHELERTIYRTYYRKNIGL